MANDKDLQGLFHETLKDIYFAEKKILSALPKMAKAAQSEELRAAFEKHETETEEHVTRLERVFEEIEETPRGKTCDAIIGIIEEGQDVMKEFKGAPALDEHGDQSTPPPCWTGRGVIGARSHWGAQRWSRA